MSNPRRLAADILVKIEKDGAYSNIAVSQQLRKSELNDRDRALTTALVYGVLDRKITLDYGLSLFLKSPLEKAAPLTRQVLRTALYQIMYMDRIPDRAAVDEAVKAVKKSKEYKNAGFVNGVLRNILRSGIILPEDDSIESMSIRYSCPEWIIESFITDYGIDTAKLLLEDSLKPPQVTVRVNTLVTDKDSVCEELKKQGIPYTFAAAENALNIEYSEDISKNKLYSDGCIYVQDAASQKAVSVLAPKPGDRVLDMCAAPGGKSFTMAQYMENRGEIIACDLHEHRVRLISESAQRLGISIIKAVKSDARVYRKDMGVFDCILCDVPCSGLGVIRRKPDIKYNQDADLSQLEETQYRILCNAAKYLRKGGKLLYSTCTLRKAENEKLVIRFEKEYNDFYKCREYIYMPHTDGTDGFYCALLMRRDV